MAVRWLGLDIGGANLKLSDGGGFSLTHAFPLWEQPEELAQELRTLLAEAGQSDHLAATMTGELADCFESQQAGVEFIIDALSEAASGRHTRLYLKNGTLVTLPVGRRKPELAAASNWHALARFCCRYVTKGTGLLLDVGSTTSDVIPLTPEGLGETGTTETQRLCRGEMVYTGVERSPVCAVAPRASYRGTGCRLAQEVFATMRDVYLILGELPEEPASLLTADGRPATKPNARRRLGRSICAEEGEFNHKNAVEMATSLAFSQLELLAEGVREVVARQEKPPGMIVISGQGEFLARQAAELVVPEAKIVSLGARLGPIATKCAPAHALAMLAREANA